MSRNEDNHKTKYDLDQLLKESFGVDDDQLLKEFQLAQQEIDDSQIPPEPEDGFERLMGKIEERRIKPCPLQNEPVKERRKGRILGPIIKVAIAFGVLSSLIFVTGITAGGKEKYEFVGTKRNVGKSNVVYNNGENIESEDDLEQTYQKIHDNTGIKVLNLGYVPLEMKYNKTAINNRHATIYFEYKGNSFYMVQEIRTELNSNNLVSDRENQMVVYNKWLKRNIVIEKAVFEDGEKELNAHIVEGDSHYYLAGIIEEEEFIKIVESLCFSNNYN